MKASDWMMEGLERSCRSSESMGCNLKMSSDIKSSMWICSSNESPRQEIDRKSVVVVGVVFVVVTFVDVVLVVVTFVDVVLVVGNILGSTLLVNIVVEELFFVVDDFNLDVVVVVGGCCSERSLMREWLRWSFVVLDGTANVVDVVVVEVVVVCWLL